MIRNFTPLLDSIVERFDLLTAAVYGRIWRYQQMGKGRCLASQGRIANDLKVGRATVQRRIYILIDAGYLKDVTPHGSLTSHYITTERAGIEIAAYDYNKPASERGRGVHQRDAGSASERGTKKERKKYINPNKKDYTGGQYADWVEK